MSAAEGAPLPDDVALYIASLASIVKLDIRDVENLLIRVIAYSSLSGREISVPLAHEVIRNALVADTGTVRTALQGMSR
jgi:chromosomal replication initiator protein